MAFVISSEDDDEEEEKEEEERGGTKDKKKFNTECGPMTNVMAALPNIHRVSKNVPPLACYRFDAHEWILIFLAEILPIKRAIRRRFSMPPQITCASALPGKTGKNENHIFTQLDCVTRTMHQCVSS